MTIDRRSFIATATSLAATAVLRPTLAVPGPGDPLGVRGDFPITAKRTYLNTAYIAPIPRQVLAAGQSFMEKRSLEPLSVGDLLRQVGATRGKFARLINASPEEVTLLYATSEGENIVANSIPWVAGDNVVIDDLHYEAAFVIYRQLEARQGVQLRIAPNRDGVVEARDMEPLIDARTRLVSVAWVSSVNGYRHDMRPIADLAHAHGAIVYADAIQAVGMFPVDVQASGVDALCCGTYKWLVSGFGVAPFYVRREVLDRIKPDRFGAFSVERELPDHQFVLRSKTAGKFTYATLPFVEVYQLAASLDYLEQVGVSRIEAHTVALAQRLQNGLLAQGYRLVTPPGTKTSIVTFRTAKAAELGTALSAARVDTTVREQEVRVSAALFNTEEDIDRILSVTHGRS